MKAAQIPASRLVGDWQSVLIGEPGQTAPPVTLWSASHTPAPPLCATTELLLQSCHFAHSFIDGNAPPTTARRAPAEIDLAPTPSGPGKRRPIAGGRIHAPLQSLTRPAQGATY